MPSATEEWWPLGRQGYNQLPLIARAPAREALWPVDRVERWPIDRLIPYAKNYRTHSEAQIAAGPPARVIAVDRQGRARWTFKASPALLKEGVSRYATGNPWQRQEEQGNGLRLNGLIYVDCAARSPRRRPRSRVRPRFAPRPGPRQPTAPDQAGDCANAVGANAVGAATAQISGETDQVEKRREP